MSETGELIIYQAEDGATRVTCRVAEGTLWLPQSEPATCKDYLQVRSEGKREVRV